MKILTYCSVIAVLVLWGCQTPPPAPTPSTEAPAATAPEEKAPTPDPSTLSTDQAGFSPRAQTPANTLTFHLHFGNPDQVRTWSVAFLGPDGNVVPGPSGTAPNRPPSFSWDGRGPDGTEAPEGTYTARLTVDLGAPGGTVTADSSAFLLDRTPASGTVEVSPVPFQPGDPNTMVDAPNVTLVLHLKEGPAPIVSWRMGILHPDGRRFMDFISEDHHDNTVIWNGRAVNNNALDPDTTYQVVTQVFDRYGNVGTVTGSLVVGKPVPSPARPAPVTVTWDGHQVGETQIYFPAFSADLSRVSPPQAAANDQALNLLAELLRSATGAKILVVGHANKVFWWDGPRGDREQAEVLIPLSRGQSRGRPRGPGGPGHRPEAVRSSRGRSRPSGSRFQRRGEQLEEPPGRVRGQDRMRALPVVRQEGDL